MRQLILLFSLLFVGCVNDISAIAIDELRQLENTSETPRTVYVPLPTIDYSEDLDVPYFIYEPCICEYSMWENNSLICLGIRCTEECSEEIRSCNESHRACVPKNL